MPFIHVEMIEGRSREQKEALVKEVTEVVSKHPGAPTEHIPKPKTLAKTAN